MISSYLTNQTFSVSYSDITILSRPLSFGVPEGSVLGPLLFSLYTVGMGPCIESHGFQCHFYTNDSQIDLSGPDVISLLFKITECLLAISYFFSLFVKLNMDKTEFIIFSPLPLNPFIRSINQFNGCFPQSCKSVTKQENTGLGVQ